MQQEVIFTPDSGSLSRQDLEKRSGWCRQELCPWQTAAEGPGWTLGLLCAQHRVLLGSAQLLLCPGLGQTHGHQTHPAAGWTNALWEDLSPSTHLEMRTQG